MVKITKDLEEHPNKVIHAWTVKIDYSYQEIHLMQNGEWLKSEWAWALGKGVQRQLKPITNEEATKLLFPDISQCTCDPGLLDPQREQERFNRMVCLELPIGSRDRHRRIEEGLSTQVAVDPCIVDQIKFLWGKGIETLGCCCGHNRIPAWVNVDKGSIHKMVEMGYKPDPTSELQSNTFLLKTKFKSYGSY